MKKLCFLLLIIGLCLAYPTGGMAGVNVDIGIGIGFPPPVVYQAPPPVVVLPGGAPYVYYAPGVQVDLFFYGGYWWRPYEGHWYRSHYYDRGWAYVEPRRVPRPFYHLPPDYRQRNYGYAIPHGELNHKWSRWEKERHWDNYQKRGPNQNYQGYNQGDYQQYNNRNQNKQGHGTPEELPVKAQNRIGPGGEDFEIEILKKLASTRGKEDLGRRISDQQKIGPVL